MLRPSEDWSGQYFTDYNSPATYRELQDFIRQHGMNDPDHSDKEYIDFLERAINDSLDFYQAVHSAGGQFSGIVKADVDNNKNFIITPVDNREYYDGIRSLWRISQSLMGWTESQDHNKFATNAYLAGKDKQFTYSPELDRAMYLTQAMNENDTEQVIKTLKTLLNNTLPKDKYYEHSLIVLGLLTALFPNRIKPESTTNTTNTAIMP